MPLNRTNNLIDARALLDACGGNPTLLGKLIHSFNCRAQRDLQDIGQAIELRNAGELRKTAHKLRGFVCTFSSAAAEIAGVLEDAAIDQQFDHISTHYRRLEEMLAALTALLAHLRLEDLQRR